VTCPVAALKAWLEAAGINAERVGLDPAVFMGHLMRAGFLTSAAKRGASIFKMMDQSRHRSVETLRGYVHDAETLIRRMPSTRPRARRARRRQPREEAPATHREK
jgi:hypothetical protein